MKKREVPRPIRGERGAASNSGERGAASNSGERGAASNSGEEGIAMSLGIESKAKAIKGTWIVLSEWRNVNGNWHRKDVQVKTRGRQENKGRYLVHPQKREVCQSEMITALKENQIFVFGSQPCGGAPRGGAARQARDELARRTG